MVGTKPFASSLNGLDGESKSAAWFVMQDSYENIGWDFDNVWRMPSPGSKHPYPVLKWQEIEQIREPQADEIEVYTAAELSAMRNNLNASYIQMADINLSGVDWEPIGDIFTPFEGKFDGNGYSINNLSITRPIDSFDQRGLFDTVAGAQLNNITMLNVNLNGAEYVGSITGTAWADTIIENSTVTGTITAVGYVGGIAGSLQGGSDINNSRSAVDITILGGGMNGGQGGGIVGDMLASRVINSYSTGEINGSSNTRAIGGIAGDVQRDSYIESSHSTVDISDADLWVGGIAGYLNDSSIKNSYSRGEINANRLAGGIAGYALSNSSIDSSYNTGNITTTEDAAGGIAGVLNNSSIKDSYSMGNIKATTDYAGGIVGRMYVSAKIKNSYSTGSITATRWYAGGIAGAAGDDVADDSEISYCAAINSSVTASDAEVGRIAWVHNATLIGNNAVNSMPGSDVGADKKDGESQNAAWFTQQSSYEGMFWDFTDVWKMEADSQYPILKWQ